MTRTLYGALGLTLLLGNLPAAADGLWRDFYRGLDIIATPTGGPLVVASDGTRINGQRNGRLRFVPNTLGKGWDIEFDRGFGPDSRGRPEIFDIGPAELELSGAVQSTLGYTSRGFLIGNANTTISDLSYRFETKTGAQDVQLVGTLNATTDLMINQFGFYDLSVNVQNTEAQLTVDGVLVDQEETAEFDVGPISIKGNIFFDGFLALLASAGVDTSQLSAITPESPIDRINEAIQESIRKQEFAASTRDAVTATDARIDLLANAQTAVLATALGLPTGDVSREIEALLGQNALNAGTAATPDGSAVPEPASLALVLLGGLMFRRRS